MNLVKKSGTNHEQESGDGRPKVHVSNRGCLYVNAEEVASSDVGQKV